MTSRYVVVAASAAALLALAGCSQDEGPTVRLADVGRESVTEVVEAPATVVARATATLSSPATGTVAEVLVEDGAAVTPGQVVVRIDSPTATEQLARAREADQQAASAGQVYVPPSGVGASTRAAQERAAQGYDRAREAAGRIPDPAAREQALAALEASQAQSDALLDQAAATARQVQAGLGSVTDALASLSAAQRVQTQAAVAAAQQVVDALVVSAPIAGTVSLGAASSSSSGSDPLAGLLGGDAAGLQGQADDLLGGAGAPSGAQGVLVAGLPVSTGQGLAVVTDASVLTVAAEVDETDVLLVQPGVEADVELDAVPGASYGASVTSVDAAPSTAGGGVSYLVRMTLGSGTTAGGSPAAVPRPGMSAVAALRVRTAENAVAVPVSALVRDGVRDTVWVVEGDAARRRVVELGALGEDVAEVVRGVAAGERVVVEGADTVSEGQQVP